MTHLERLALTLAIIFISLGLGYLCKHLTENGKLPFGPNFLVLLRKRLQVCAILGLMPFSAMLSLWGLANPGLGLFALPLLGLASYVWGGALAIFAARMLKLGRTQTGSFYCCGTFTNIAAVGGLVCLLFLGEDSIALVALYRLLEEIYYFGVSFPIARRYQDRKENTGDFRKIGADPVLLVIVAALLLGITLNLASVPRPLPAGAIASGGMLLATIFCLFAIGLSLRLSRIFSYWRPGLAMCAIKFVGSPLLITPLAAVAGLGAFDNGIALKVVAALSSMPVAMTALVPPSLFDLDVDMANACWIFSTLGLIVVLPALMFILPTL